MDAQRFQARRSLIFVPGNRVEIFPKALTTGSDIVCIDLEDGVAPQHKDDARAQTLALFETPQADDGVERIVRINCTRTPEGLRDLIAIIETDTPPPAIMLTKVKAADEVRALDELLTDSCPDIRFHVIIETNDGLDACYEIAQSSPRIDSILFGAVDMAAELRVSVDWEPLLYSRSRLVHAAAAAEIDLIDVPFLDLDDMAGLEREANSCASLGFTGKGAIHPKQISTINRAFSPADGTVDRARRIIAAFAESDSGLVLIDGKLIEKPVLRSMQRIVAIADQIGQG